MKVQPCRHQKHCYLHLLKIHTTPPANNRTKDFNGLDILISCFQFTISLQEDFNETHVAAQTIKNLECVPPSCGLHHYIHVNPELNTVPFDLWPPKFDRFSLEFKLTFEPNLLRLLWGVFEMLWSHNQSRVLSGHHGLDLWPLTFHHQNIKSFTLRSKRIFVPNFKGVTLLKRPLQTSTVEKKTSFLIRSKT